MAARKENVFAFLRKGGAELLEHERQFWRDNRAFWEERANRQSARTLELEDRARQITAEASKETPPADADAAVETLTDDVHRHADEVNDLNREVTGENAQGLKPREGPEGAQPVEQKPPETAPEEPPRTEAPPTTPPDETQPPTEVPPKDKPEPSLKERRDEMRRKAAENERLREEQRQMAREEQADRDRASGVVSQKAEKLALEDVKNDPMFDPSRDPIVGESAVKGHLGHPGESGVKMPEFGYWRKDGSFVTVEVKNQKHPDSPHAVEKFETVSRFGNEVPPGAVVAREPKRAYILEIPVWAEVFSDPNHTVINGTLHYLGQQVLIDGVPIEVKRLSFPKP